MSRLLYNGVLAHLAADLTAGATTMTLDVPLTHSGGTNVPTISGGDYLPVTILDENAVPREIVHITGYTAGSTTVTTMTRGQEGTSGVTHTAGVIVLHAPTVYDNNPLTNGVWAAKGDLLVGTGNDTAVIKSIGASGTVLTADPAEAGGMKWALPGGWTKIVDDPLSSTAGLNSPSSGAWAINAGVLRTTSSGSVNRVTFNTLPSPCGIVAAEVEFASVSGSGTRRLGISIRSNNASSNTVVYLESTNGTAWSLRCENDGESLLFAENIAWDGTGYVKLQTIDTGDGIDMYWNGTQVSYVRNNRGPVSQKYVGLYVYGSTSHVVDMRNAKVWRGLSVPW